MDGVPPNHCATNPAHTYKNQSRKGYAKTLLLPPTLLPINLPYKTQHHCLKIAKLLVSFL